MGTDSDRRTRFDSKTTGAVRKALRQERREKRKEEIRTSPELINPPKKPHKRNGFN